MNPSKKAFTLVELIVVITILAILWTVAFVSLQEYATYARNAVRLDGISKVATVVQVKTQAWIWVMSFVGSGNEVPLAQIWWTTAIVGNDYKAWDINTTALEIKGEDFSDPVNDNLFLIWATTKKWVQYEVASSVEDSWSDRAIVNANYEPRASETLVWTGILLENTFTLSDTRDINKLFKWDTISWTGVPTDTTVKSISNDGLTITLSNDFSVDSNDIQLATHETSGLIISVNGVIPVTAGTLNIPYNISSTSSSLIVVVPSIVTCESNPIWSTFEEDWVTYKVVENGTGANGIRNTANIALIDNANNTNLCTSNVTDMSSVFLNNTAFNENISNWDTSNVTFMQSMFSGASSFNQDIWYWDTSSVENIVGIFNGASSFNQDIWNWDITSTLSISNIFNGASSFNQDIWNWETLGIESMRNTFLGAISFNQDISWWNVDNVNAFAWFDTDTSPAWISAHKPNF